MNVSVPSSESISIVVILAELLELPGYVGLEFFDHPNDLRDDLSTARVLIVYDFRLLLGPLQVSTLSDQAFLCLCLHFDLLDKDSDKLVNSILVLIKEDLNTRFDRFVNVSKTILFKSLLLVFFSFELDEEVSSLLVQLLFKLHAELDKLRRDSVREAFS